MESSLQKILAGYRTFKEKYAKGDTSLMAKLAEGQSPEVMVVTCSDSRVDPAVIFQCDPGELFTVRSVANIVPPYEPGRGDPSTGAALEYGICYLKIKQLIIMGHSECGGVNAFMDPSTLTQNDFIEDWVSVIGNDNKPDGEAMVPAKQALIRSWERAMGYPWIRSEVEAGQLGVHGWFFDIKTGTIEAYDPDSGEFATLD